MNKYLKYTLRGFGILVLVLLVLYLIVYIYVSANKKSIVKQVTEEIGEKLNGDVTIGNIELSFFTNFPRISVLMEKISIKDSMFQKHKHHFLQADEISFLVNVRKLINKQSPISGVTVTNANVYLYTDTSGYTNTYLFKPKKKSAAAVGESVKGKNELKEIILNDVRLVLDDQTRNKKLHDLMVNELTANIDERGDLMYIDVDNDILVNSLAFNLKRGSFLKGKVFSGDFQVRYNKNSKQLAFDNIATTIGGHPFRLTGKFDLGTNGKPQFALKASSNNILFTSAKSFVTPKITEALAIVGLDKPLAVDLDMNGPLKGGDPLVKVNWATSNNLLTTPFLNFENASFKGSFTNEVTPGLPRKDPNSKITLKDFTATWHGLPITSHSIEVVNLATPLLVADLRSKFPLTQLNEALNSSTIQLNAGQGMINITYKGPIQKNQNTNSFINGVISVDNALVHYAPRDVDLKNVNSRIVFKSSDVFVENLEGVVLGNKIVMQGVAKDLLTVISTEPNKAVLDWNIYSPSLNLTAFAYLLRPQKKTVTVRKRTGTSLEKSAEQIDEVIAKGSIKVKLRADKLTYKKFAGNNATAALTLLNDRYILHNVSLGHAGGKMDLNGFLLHSSGHYNNANVNISLANVDVNEVFSAFNNFGQDGITADNIRGKLDSDISVNVTMNEEGQVYKESVQGIIDFSLKNGALVNYEPLKKMQVFILKNRDFNNIKFAELKDRLEIKNQEIKINKLEIQSSVLTMFVQGIYSLKGNTDIQVQVPLSNLKKRDENYIPKNLGEGKKAGSSVYLRGTPGKDGNIKFKLDLFNKFKGDKDGDNK